MLEWLWELYAEDPDNEWLRPQIRLGDDFEPQRWHDLYFRAFDALQYDRFYGAMGGEGPIYYSALSQWARDHELSLNEFTDFQIFINALDGEWLSWRREQDEADRQRKAQEDARR